MKKKHNVKFKMTRFVGGPHHGGFQVVLVTDGKIPEKIQVERMDHGYWVDSPVFVTGTYVAHGQFNYRWSGWD